MQDDSIDGTIYYLLKLKVFILTIASCLISDQLYNCNHSLFFHFQDSKTNWIYMLEYLHWCLDLFKCILSKCLCTHRADQFTLMLLTI